MNEAKQIFAEDANLFIERHNKFRLLEDSRNENNLFLRGKLDVIDFEGKDWNSFDIEIHNVEKYPFRFPKVFEISNRIPPIGDWHINENDRSCCIKVLPAELIACHSGITLLSFYEKEVIPYFFNQTHRIMEGFYINGEFAHNISGIYQFYSEVLNTGRDYRKTISLLTSIAQSPKPGRTHECFCGSREKFRKCHGKAYRKLSLIESQDLLYHIQIITEAFK